MFQNMAAILLVLNLDVSEARHHVHHRSSQNLHQASQYGNPSQRMYNLNMADPRPSPAQIAATNPYNIKEEIPRVYPDTSVSTWVNDNMPIEYRYHPSTLG